MSPEFLFNFFFTCFDLDSTCKYCVVFAAQLSCHSHNVYIHAHHTSSIIREWNIHSGQCLRDVYGHEAYIYGYVMCQMHSLYIVPCMHDTAWSYLYTAFHSFLEEEGETLCPVEKIVLSEYGKVGSEITVLVYMHVFVSSS